MKLLLPVTLADAPTLPPGVEPVWYDPAQPIPLEHRDAECLVTWGNPGWQLAEAAGVLAKLRWVQSLAAGPDSVLDAGFGPAVTITSGVGLHSRTVAEHALALILALVTRLPQSAKAQAGHRWADELGGLRPLHHEGPVTTLLGARVLVWGFGSIGTTIAPLLAQLGASVRGVARSAGERFGFPVIAQDDVDSALGETDVLLMILPGGEATWQGLSEARLRQLPSRAYVVNVGRGTTIDEDALVAALREGRLAGAALDVTAVEPLPADSPLWEAPNLLLTPHAAGGRPVGADVLIRENVEALLAGRPLRNVIVSPAAS